MEYKFKIITIENTLNSIVESFLPTFEKEKGLSAKLSFTASYYGNNVEISEYENIEIFFYRPTAYTKVCYRLHSTDNFKQVADHSSCWREGVNRCISEAVKSIESKLEDAFNEHNINVDTIDEKDIHIYTRFGHIKKAFSILNIENIEKHGDGYNCEYSIKFKE